MWTDVECWPYARLTLREHWVLTYIPAYPLVHTPLHALTATYIIDNKLHQKNTRTSPIMPFLAKEHYPIPTKDILSWSFDNINYDHDKAIYIDALNPKNSISTRQARTLIRKLIAGLRALGFQKGDCACINSFNDIHYPMVFLGLVGAGGIFSGVNPGYTPHELAHTLKIAKVKFVFVQPALLEATLKATDQVGIARERIIIFNPNGETAPEGVLQWRDLLKHGEEDWVRFDELETAKWTPAARLFSSGTTGLPKAADLSHYNLVAQHTLLYETNPRPWERRVVLALPMFHAATAPGAFCSFIRPGARAFVLPRFEPERWFWCHEEYKLTDLLVVPPMAIFAINSPLNKKYSLKSVKIATCGAAPLDKLPQSRLQALIGEDVAFTQVWGMTETSCVATRFPWPETDTTGSVGRPMPGLDLKLVDDDGKDVSGPDRRGELCIRGPTVINGYFENPEANARDWDSEGYFHTGDIAFMDGKTELLYIVDRKKVKAPPPYLMSKERANEHPRNSSKCELFKSRHPKSKAYSSITPISPMPQSLACRTQTTVKARSSREPTWCGEMPTVNGRASRK